MEGVKGHMGTVTFSKILPYVRQVPHIYGQENLYDADALLAQNNTQLKRFTAHVFPGEITSSHEGGLRICTQDRELGEDLALENDEISLVDSNTVGAITKAFADDCVIIPLIRPGYTIYGHWLLDLLPKVNFFRTLHPDLKHKLLIHENTPKWAISIIEAFGSGEMVTIKSDSWVKGNFFLMSPVRHHDYISEICYLDKLSPRPSTVGQRKLYLSREKVGVAYRNFHNSKEVEQLFTEYGFEVLYPEQHSIEEQVKIFANARVLAGEGGSALHNNILCAPGTRIINLQSGRQNHLIQASLCKWYDQAAEYVFGPSDTDDWGAGYSIPEQYCRQILSGLDD